MLNKLVVHFLKAIVKSVNFLNSCILIFGGAYYVPLTCRSHYFMSIVDDASRAVWVYLMHDKGETSSFLQNFVIYAKNHFGKNVNFIRSDNGKEFTFRHIRQFYSEKEIGH